MKLRYTLGIMTLLCSISFAGSANALLPDCDFAAPQYGQADEQDAEACGALRDKHQCDFDCDTAYYGPDGHWDSDNHLSCKNDCVDKYNKRIILREDLDLFQQVERWEN